MFVFMQNQFPKMDVQDQFFGLMESAISEAFTAAAIVYVIFFVIVVAVPLFLIAFLIYRHIKSDKKVRLELAKHGIIAPMETSKPAPDKNRMLRNAFLCIGTALGLICGILISLVKDFDMTTKFLIFCSSALLFLGFSFLAYSMYIDNKKPNVQTNN